MEFNGGNNLLKEGDEFDGGGEGNTAAEAVCCSICLDSVTDDGKRSWAKLQCSHQFHLDCIGSAFNAKRAMQCPNCRKVEKGDWLIPEGTINRNSIPVQELFNAADASARFYSLYGYVEDYGPAAPTTAPSFSPRIVPYHVPVHPSSSTYYGGTASTVAWSSGQQVATYHETIHSSLSTSGSMSYNMVDEVAVIMDLSSHYHSVPSSSSRLIRGVGVGDERQTAMRSRYDVPRQQQQQQRRQQEGYAITQRPFVVDQRGHPYQDSIARSRDRVNALEAYSHQSSNNPHSARRPSRSMPCSSGSISGSSGRSNNQNSTRNRAQLPLPVGSPVNHAASRLPWSEVNTVRPETVFEPEVNTV